MKSRRKKKDGNEYISLGTCDYDDSQSDRDSEVEDIMNHKSVIRRAKSNIGCFQFIFILSSSGAIFLTIIAYLLYNDSIYLRVRGPEDGGKPKLAKSVFVAAIMYAIVALLTLAPSRQKLKVIYINDAIEKIKNQI